LYWYSMIL